MRKPTVIVITGPTASGKSALAVSLARRLQTEIISADSRQIFRGIPIVTAVPSEEEREGVAHYLIEELSLDSYYSAACFQEDASKILDNILKRNDTAVVCGGSMLYIDALINGIDDLPTVPIEIRENLTKEWEINGDEWLKEKLKDLDPAHYDKVDLNNLKRVFHAIEITQTAGVPYSSLLTLKENSADRLKVLPYNIIKICMAGNREILFHNINKRVSNMVEEGLEEEARQVYHLRHLNSLNTVGLKEMFSYFDGNLDFETAIRKIQKNTRVYAKKQMTWHKRDINLRYLDFSDSKTVNVEKILKLLV